MHRKHVKHFCGIKIPWEPLKYLLIRMSWWHFMKRWVSQPRNYGYIFAWLLPFPSSIAGNEIKGWRCSWSHAANLFSCWRVLSVVLFCNLYDMQRPHVNVCGSWWQLLWPQWEMLRSGPPLPSHSSLCPLVLMNLRRERGIQTVSVSYLIPVNLYQEMVKLFLWNGEANILWFGYLFFPVLI